MNNLAIYKNKTLQKVHKPEYWAFTAHKQIFTKFNRETIRVKVYYIYNEKRRRYEYIDPEGRVYGFYWIEGQGITEGLVPHGDINFKKIRCPVRFRKLIERPEQMPEAIAAVFAYKNPKDHQRQADAKIRKEVKKRKKNDPKTFMDNIRLIDEALD